MNTRNQRDQMYVFWFSDFTLQNYFHIKKGNGQVDSENTVGNKVKKKQFFCQLDFWTAVKKSSVGWTHVKVVGSILHETFTQGLDLMILVGAFQLRIFCGLWSTQKL